MKKGFLGFSTLISGLIVLGLAYGFRPMQDKKPWPVPDASKNKKNPVASDANSISAGKELWATHCKSCHGNKGLGDGSKAAQLKTEPGDFSKAETQAQSDGSLFYKISEGRDDMPSFKKKIPEQDDIWNLVNFVRTLKK
jgi:mono/diheme cytochrome c family protein